MRKWAGSPPNEVGPVFSQQQGSDWAWAELRQERDGAGTKDKFPKFTL